LTKVQNGMSWNRWNWLDDGALPLAIAVLRVCWLWPWLVLLQRWLAPTHQGTLLSPVLILALLLSGAVMARWALRLPSNRARTAVAVAGLAVIFVVLWWRLYRTQFPVWEARWLGAWATDMVDWVDWETRGVPAPFFALIAMAYVWLRGVLDGGRQSLMREQVWGVFAVGFVALALLLLLAQLDQRGLPEGTGNLLWAFFAAGMASLSLAGLKTVGGLESVSGPEGRATPARPQLDRYWLGGVLTVSLVLLGLALVLSALIAPEVAAQLLRAGWTVISQLIIYLWFAVSLVLLPVAYLLALLFAPFLERIADFQLELQTGMDEVFGSRDLPEQGERTITILDSLPGELRWVALAILIALVSLAFGLALRRIVMKPRRGGIEESRESVLSRDLLQDQLSELWQSLLGRLRRRAGTRFDPFLSLEGEPQTRRIVRSVYQALLASAQERGQPRARSQTPIEYRRKLEEEWPVGHEELDTITGAYVRARYALAPPTLEQAQRVTRAWEQLQAAAGAEGGRDTNTE
jgi:hypothetical protein